MMMIDLVINKRQSMSRDERQVDGLIAVLRKIAADLESGNAVELDFNIKTEQLDDYDEFNITLQTFHKRYKRTEVKEISSKVKK